MPNRHIRFKLKQSIWQNSPIKESVHAFAYNFPSRLLEYPDPRLMAALQKLPLGPIQLLTDHDLYCISSPWTRVQISDPQARWSSLQKNEQCSTSFPAMVSCSAVRILPPELPLDLTVLCKVYRPPLQIWISNGNLREWSWHSRPLKLLGSLSRSSCDTKMVVSNLRFWSPGTSLRENGRSMEESVSIVSPYRSK